MITYAFSHPARPRTVAIWCEKRGDGYHVLNGDWDYTPEEYGGTLIWEGECPHDLDYNAAINWIQEQLDVDDHQQHS